MRSTLFCTIFNWSTKEGLNIILDIGLAGRESMEDDKQVEQDRQRAEVFDALGHPTRLELGMPQSCFHESSADDNSRKKLYAKGISMFEGANTKGDAALCHRSKLAIFRCLTNTATATTERSRGMITSHDRSGTVGIIDGVAVGFGVIVPYPIGVYCSFME